MNTIDWPHEKICSAALRYITKHAIKESSWRFTCLDRLPERLGRIVRLEASERPIVTCFIDAQRWYAMTTARVFGVLHGSRFDCSPVEVAQWRWGNFKRDGRSEMDLCIFPQPKSQCAGTCTFPPTDTKLRAFQPAITVRVLREVLLVIIPCTVRGCFDPMSDDFANRPMSSALTREELLNALRSLSDKLGEQGITGELCLFGGTVMVSLSQLDSPPET